MRTFPSNASYTDVFELEDIDGDQLQDVDGDILYMIWTSEPFNPLRTKN